MKYRVPGDVAWLSGHDLVETDDAVYVMRVPDGVPVVLSGTASLIWELAVAGESVVDAVAEGLAVADEHVAGDVQRFLTQLCDHGLLEPAPQEDQ